ncbi:hypothetical protein B4923_16110 [Brenneria roseae subsp. americana]|uniref:Uncharacterized protein n=1 Tax=Brenneria roseae subsp. americana TaxID=1508507 RepID=A0A2U1TMJ1_9GAMM|nr:hypothetical protein [Brenneria roseae]PWC10644.1 hypothetical protein B4923_16110 [Brenneria roseae subsp. americana]
MATGKIAVRVVLDTADIDRKVEELAGLIKSRFPDGAPDFLDSHLSSVCDDIILTDGPPATGADGTDQIVQRVDFGRRFDDLATAIRTGNFNAH